MLMFEINYVDLSGLLAIYVFQCSFFRLKIKIREKFQRRFAFIVEFFTYNTFQGDAATHFSIFTSKNCKHCKQN